MNFGSDFYLHEKQTPSPEDASFWIPVLWA